MEIVGTVRRIVRKPDDTYYIWIPVCCSKEGDHKSYHRVIPDFLVPYKHYDAETISKGIADNAELDIASLPSDSSIYRWKKWICALYKKLTDKLNSCTFDPLLQILRKINFRNSDNCVELVTVFYSLSFKELVDLIKELVKNDFEVKLKQSLCRISP